MGPGFASGSLKDVGTWKHDYIDHTWKMGGEADGLKGKVSPLHKYLCTLSPVPTSSLLHPTRLSSCLGKTKQNKKPKLATLSFLEGKHLPKIQTDPILNPGVTG